MTFALGSLYHGTKFAVEGISESLHYEMAEIGVKVKIVEPGFIATDFGGRSFDFQAGEISSYHTKRLSDFALDAVKDRVDFYQADACNLKPLYTDYDLVLACNLIDRLYDPARFLESIHKRIRIGGLLILVSPYTWKEEFTQRDKWIGGFRKDGENLEIF